MNITVKDISIIRINIDGKEYELSRDEARQLFNQLKTVFNDRNETIKWENTYKPDILYEQYRAYI